MTNAQPRLALVPNPAGRAPQHDLGSECLLLGAVMLDETALDRIAGTLKPECFWQANHQMIFEAAVDLASKGQPHGLHEVAAWLRAAGKLDYCGGPTYLVEVVNGCHSVSALEHHARVVRDLWRVRSLQAACQRYAAEAYGPTADPQALLEEAEATVSAIAAAPDAAHTHTARASLQAVFEELQARHDGTLRLLPTGFAELDALMGLQGGELSVLAGRPGMGKTAAGMAVALHVCSRLTGGEYRDAVAVFSLEMSHQALMTRAIATEARVDLQRVRRGEAEGPEWSRLASAGRHLAELPLWVDDQSNLTPYDLRAKARRCAAEARKAGKRLALVVVDYLQIMSAVGLVPDRAPEHERLAFISRSLKALAKELDVPIVALAQLNRESAKGTNKRPGLHDLRGSGAIEQDADNVIFLHREEYYLGDQTPPESRGVAELILAKQRNGPVGVARTRYYPKHVLLADDARAQ